MSLFTFTYLLPSLPTIQAAAPWPVSWLSVATIVMLVHWLLYRYVYAYTSAAGGALPLPPGPPGLPFIGNALQLGRQPHLVFDAWQKRYGDVVHIRMFHRDWIILSSERAVQELLCKRGAHYSGRPALYLSGDVMHRGSAILPLRPADDKWRVLRRIAAAAFRSDRLPAYTDALLCETHRATRRLLQASKQHGTAGVCPAAHLDRLALNGMLRIVFGRHSTVERDPLLGRFAHTIDRVFQLSGHRSMLVDYFPWLRFVQRRLCTEVAQVSDDLERIRHQLVERVRAGRSSGPDDDGNDGDACFTGQVLAAQASTGLSDMEVRELTSIMVGAGFETTALSLRWALLLLAAHPDMQHRLQATLDTVVGRARTPQHDDLARLPYLHATIKECLRMRNPAVLGVPHCTDDREDVYRGWRIPRHTTVVINTHSLHHSNQGRFSDADQFRPERFMSTNDNSDGDVSDKSTMGIPNHWAFGAGRRVCVGKQFAEYKLALSLATFMWAFKVLPALDTNGHPIPLSMDYFEHGLASTHRPYRIRILPRDDNVYHLLQDI